MSSIREAKLSTPLVLAVSSAMVCIGVLAWYSTRPASEHSLEDELRLEAATPERAAEAFLDAWRKRDHERALALSTGAAADAVRARRASDAALSEGAREQNQQIWSALAASRLAFSVRESETLEDGRLVLRGVAEGTFLERPYRREVAFVTNKTGSAYKIQQVDFGPILSDVKAMLELPEPEADRSPDPNAPGSAARQ